MDSRRAFFKKTAGLAAVATALASGEVRADGVNRHNLITAVKRARIFDLSHLWDETSPIAGVNPPYSMTLDPNQATGAANHASTRGTFGDNGQLSFAGEVQHWSGQHGAPNFDTIGHIGQDGLLFGGVDAAASTSNPLGIGRSGVGAHLDVAHYPKELLINHAVLLDVARFINRSDAPFRTGWGQYFSTNAALYAGADAAGVGVTGAQYLVKQGAKVVGNDTLTFEVRPPISFPPEVPQFQVFPVHMLLIPQNGIYIIENYYLEEIAEAKEYEFLLVVPPLKIRGGTGSALRSFALVP
jgi:hypothetical protein